MKANPEREIEELLGRNVAEFIDPDGLFKKKLKDNPERVVIKLGVDPTKPDIHIGHAVILRKLRKFQDFGCKVVFLVGDFTALIGDPSGKSKVRSEVSRDEVEANMKTYLEQVNKILKTDPRVFSWIRNSDWFLNVTDLAFGPEQKGELVLKKDGQEMVVPIDPNSFVGKAFAFEQSRMQVKELGLKNKIAVVTLKSFLSTLRKITHSRLIERDMFQERIKGGGELYMHEMMYPVLQGIDSSVMAMVYGSCDLEVGGTDQTFNMLMGRDIMKQNNQEPQAVMSFELLIGIDGREKMSKSLDNYIGITESPDEMFGKVMSIPDDLIVNYFEMCTYTPLDDVVKIKKDLQGQKINPKEIKLRLAREIVAIYHGISEAKKAEDNFSQVFGQGAIPENIEEYNVAKGVSLVECLLKNKLVSSKTEAKRLINDGAIENVESKEKIKELSFVINETLVLRVGKKRFAKFIV